MADRETLMNALKKADAVGATDDARQIARMIRDLDNAAPAPASAAGAPTLSEPTVDNPLSSDAQAYRTDIHGRQSVRTAPGGIEKFVGGLKHSFDKSALGLKEMMPQGVQDAGDWLDEKLTGSKQLTPDVVRRGQAFVDETEGPTANIGQGAGDVALGLTTGRATKAGVMGDVSANALLNYATTPGNADTRGTAAAIGGGAAAGGRVLTRALKGPLKPFISPEASILIENDIQPTIGGMVSGANSGALPRAMRSLEDKATSIPIVGDVIQASKLRTTREYNKKEINDALAPLNAKLNLSGRDALARAHDIVDTTYEAVKPEIFIDPTIARPTIARALANIHNDPLMDVALLNKLNRVYAIKMEPLISTNTRLSGEHAKEIDAYLGKEARKYMQGGPGNTHLGEALYDLQDAWRASMVGTTPHARTTLQNANTAFKNLRSLSAAVPEGSTSGLFSPVDQIKGARKVKQQPTPLADVARSVIQDTVPDSGTAGRSALMSAAKLAGIGGTAAVAGATGNMVPLLTGAGLSASAYTRPGLTYLAKGFDPATSAIFKLLPTDVQRQVLKMKPKDAEHVMRQMSTQMMRATANQNQEQ